MQKASRDAFANGPQRAQPAAPDHHHLAGLEIALELGADQVERAGLARDDPGAAEPRQRERAEAERIARRDERVVGEHHQAVGALHARERVDQPILGMRLARAREQVHDHLGVRRRGEDRAAPFELAADRAGVHQVAVVRDRERAAVGRRAERLRVAQARLAGRRVAHVADRVTAGQLAQDLLVEHVADEAHRAVDEVLLAVRRRDARALLAAVLERVETEVGEMRRFGMAVHAEDAAGVVVAIGLARGGELRRRLAPTRRSRGELISSAPVGAESPRSKVESPG